MYQQPYGGVQAYPQQQLQPVTQAYVYDSNYQHKDKSSGNTALKYAAGIGGIGLGAYALSHMFSDSCSDSD